MHLRKYGQFPKISITGMQKWQCQDLQEYLGPSMNMILSGRQPRQQQKSNSTMQPQMRQLKPPQRGANSVSSVNNFCIFC